MIQAKTTAKPGSTFKRALASCRRVVLLLLFFITAAAGWLYWNAPNIDAVRPGIERYLQQELKLDTLHLGDMSWYWAGFLWIEVDKLDFSSQKHGITYHGGSAKVRIPFNTLFNGDIRPDKIHLNRGSLDIRLSDANPTLLSQLVLQLVLNQTDISWHILSSQGSTDWQGQLSDVQLSLDANKRKLELTSPALNLSTQWGEDGLPQHFKLNSNDTDWLPASIGQYISGSPRLNITLRRHDKQHWNINVASTSDQAFAISMPHSEHSYQLNHGAAEFDITIQDNTPEATLKHIDIRQLTWSLAQHKISAQGQWQDGVLNINASSDQLSMSLVWSWLKALGDADWQHWLDLMQQGTAKQVRANVALSWPDPLHALPSDSNWESMQYRVQAQLEDADIALGASNGYIQHTHANLDLNQDGLTATIKDTVLPRQLGHSTGMLRIPWDTLLLHITGTSNADVNNLLQWFGPNEVSDWQWNKARANSQFELLWDPSQAMPRQASVSLHPDGVWDITILDLPLKLTQGKVTWDLNSGLSLQDMHLSNAYMQGTFSLQAEPRHEQWKITALQARGTGKLEQLAAHFQLPISHATGNISSSLNYDGQWFGELDMKDASWKHLLGSSKKAGEPFALQYQGMLDMNPKHPTIHLSKLTSIGNAIKLHDGTASINQAGLKAQFNGLHTPSFSGNLGIDVPFDDNMTWKIDAKARYLNRNALPEKLDHPEKMIGKTWLLRADIDRFDWGDARMSGVHIKLSSEKNSLGFMQASQIHTTELDILDVDARFTLPGEGRVELRKLSAMFEQQQLTMSATLKPQPDGGMSWTGFAELHGDFGHLMNMSGMSKRFLNGDGHLLFSGRGVILKEQPWWQGLDGRLRMRVDEGRILEGGTLTTLLSVLNISRLPALLLGQRKDLSGPGIMYERLQMEAIMQDQNIRIRNVALRSSAFDLVGQGSMDIDKHTIDLYLIAKPLQNLDALLSKIPLLRDILGGKSHSLIRKVYHLSGPFADAKVKSVKPQQAGLAQPGIIERLFNLPNDWFGSSQPASQPTKADKPSR